MNIRNWLQSVGKHKEIDGDDSDTLVNDVPKCKDTNHKPNSPAKQNPKKDAEQKPANPADAELVTILLAMETQKKLAAVKDMEESSQEEHIDKAAELMPVLLEMQAQRERSESRTNNTKASSSWSSEKPKTKKRTEKSVVNLVPVLVEMQTRHQRADEVIRQKKELQRQAKKKHNPQLPKIIISNHAFEDTASTSTSLKFWKKDPKLNRQSFLSNFSGASSWKETQSINRNEMKAESRNDDIPKPKKSKKQPNLVPVLLHMAERQQKMELQKPSKLSKSYDLADNPRQSISSMADFVAAGFRSLRFGSDNGKDTYDETDSGASTLGLSTADIDGSSRKSMSSAG